MREIPTKLVLHTSHHLKPRGKGHCTLVVRLRGLRPGCGTRVPWRRTELRCARHQPADTSGAGGTSSRHHTTTGHLSARNADKPNGSPTLRRSKTGDNPKLSAAYLAAAPSRYMNAVQYLRQQGTCTAIGLNTLRRQQVPMSR